MQLLFNASCELEFTRIVFLRSVQQLLNQNYCPSFLDQEPEDQSGSVIGQGHTAVKYSGKRLGSKRLTSQNPLASPSSSTWGGTAALTPFA